MRRWILLAFLVVIGFLHQAPSQPAPSDDRCWFSTAGFEPMPSPGPDDWLSNHEEEGQTFDQFVESDPNRLSPERGVLYLQPLGELGEDAPDLETLRAFAALYFQAEVKLQPFEALLDRGAHDRVHPDTGKRQLLTTDLLDALHEDLPDDAFCRLGLTMTDLYPEDDWNYVFGQASLTTRVGVYSLARYEPGFFGEDREDGWQNRMLVRSCQVLAHETGHMFGLDHCIYYRCVMNGANNLAETDSQPLYLCPVCLRKLQWSVGFAVPQRREQLQRFCRENGLPDASGP